MDPLAQGRTLFSGRGITAVDQDVQREGTRPMLAAQALTNVVSATSLAVDGSMPSMLPLTPQRVRSTEACATTCTVSLASRVTVACSEAAVWRP